jgi:hypothetical protein
MSDPLGLRRLMAGENNNSDLLQYLTDRDPSAWNGIVAGVATAERESRIGTRRRADLVLRDRSGNPVAAVEVKLGHYFDDKQAAAYEESFGPEVPLLLAGLDADGAAATADTGRWRFLHLSAIFAMWTRSADPEAAAASAATRVLAHWDEVLSSALSTRGDASVLAQIEEPFLTRVLTRALREQLERGGADRAYSDVTLGGGNATVMAFSQIAEEKPGREFIAEIRWNLRAPTMDFRFGLDYPSGSRGEREAVWDAAKRLDDVIRADRFIAHLKAERPDLVGLLTSRGTGRPRAKGDWDEIVERGFVRGDAKHFDPGFRRDGDTRLEATARVDLERATAADVVELLGAALQYLASEARTTREQR